MLNALVVNAEMVGRDGHRAPALPHRPVVDALTAAGLVTCSLTPRPARR